MVVIYLPQGLKTPKQAVLSDTNDRVRKVLPV